MRKLFLLDCAFHVALDPPVKLSKHALKIAERVADYELSGC